ncbi:MAG: adenylyltransferase/cytidyltransferase family protein [archaeon]
MRTVMVFGTFDVLHEGHRFLFSEAKKHGTHLVVVVGRDLTVEAVKGRPPVNGQDRRLAQVQAIPEVDEVVLGEDRDKFAPIEHFRPDVICLGYDQVVFAQDLSDELKKRGLSSEIVRLAAYRPDIYSSSRVARER